MAMTLEQLQANITNRKKWLKNIDAAIERLRNDFAMVDNPKAYVNYTNISTAYNNAYDAKGGAGEVLNWYYAGYDFDEEDYDTSNLNEYRAVNKKAELALVSLGKSVNNEQLKSSNLNLGKDAKLFQNVGYNIKLAQAFLVDMKSNAVMPSFYAMNQLLTESIHLIIKFQTHGSKDEFSKTGIAYRVKIQEIFKLKRNLWAQIWGDKQIPINILNSLNELEKYFLKRYDDVEEYYGLNGGQPRTDKLTDALACYDDIIKYRKITQESTDLPTVQSVLFGSQRLYDTVKKINNELGVYQPPQPQGDGNTSAPSGKGLMTHARNQQQQPQQPPQQQQQKQKVLPEQREGGGTIDYQSNHPENTPRNTVPGDYGQDRTSSLFKFYQNK